jgi:hypothetical protein
MRSSILLLMFVSMSVHTSHQRHVAGSPARFYLLSKLGATLSIAEYTQRGQSFAAIRPATLTDLSKLGCSDLVIDNTAVSPGGGWIAIGLVGPTQGSPERPRKTLLIFDTRRLRIVFQKNESTQPDSGWFAWDSANTLYTFRELEVGSRNQAAYTIYSMRGPNWNNADLRVVRGRVQEPERYMRHFGDELKRIRAAARRLDSRGYMPALAIMGRCVPTRAWTAYLNGSLGTVSKDGKTIVAFVMISETHENAIILLRAANGWREEKIPMTGAPVSMMAWRQWVVIAQERRAHAEPGANARSVGEPSSRLWRFIAVGDLSRELDLEGNYVLPVETG